MKTILLLFSIVILCFTSSCTRCTVCKKSGVPIEKMCRDDYASYDTYRQALIDRENAGYVCF